MLNFHEKRRLKHMLFSKVVLLVLAVVVAFLAVSVWGVFQKAYETAEKREQKEAELAELQAREESLRAELDRLNTPRGLEGEIRSKFDVARAGEEVIVVVDPEPTEDISGVGATRSIWQRFLDLF